ncbi:MAG: hypothetical protein M1833_005806 [Piccolia ochrophora]|nr:MAG: hypothetical protein M1833_005806 [Piccolia ochrophora]
MRPPRLMLLLLTFVALPSILTLLSLVTSRPRRHGRVAAANADNGGGLGAWFSFHSPSSLFPPSAIISLTDDNSTFFLARPAAFGPLLPVRGRSGQLWVGSGFGDDNNGRGSGISTGAEGELGCSDVPGWTESMQRPSNDANVDNRQAKDIAGRSISRKVGKRTSKQAREETVESNAYKTKIDSKESEFSDDYDDDDGTDDHLHHPLPESASTQPLQAGQAAQEQPGKNAQPQHADIQSLQESAEIAGKVVLLSRGGCGFLEKVKWVQRRGGLALIVGDDTRGGSLVTMYAKGDTSNITVPSLFTSHTTAHLLSSLIPPGRFANGGSRQSIKTTVDENLRSKLQPKKNKRPSNSKSRQSSKPSSTTRASVKTDSVNALQVKEKRGWLRAALSKIGVGRNPSSSGLGEDSRRPPSSGQLDWVLVDDWVDEDDASQDRSTTTAESSNRKDAVKQGVERPPQSTAEPAKGDGFVIGVQDWRDPDLVASNSPNDGADNNRDQKSTEAEVKKNNDDKAKSSSSKSSKENRPIDAGRKQGAKPGAIHGKEGKGFDGGIITPGSGEYGKPEDSKAKPKSEEKEASKDTSQQGNEAQNTDGSHGWLEHLPWHDDDEDSESSDVGKQPGNTGNGTPLDSGDGTKAVDGHDAHNNAIEHEGLWVTLTPTSLSTSPFFDTLLVLVVKDTTTEMASTEVSRRKTSSPNLSHPISSSGSSTKNAELSVHFANASATGNPRPRSHTASGILAQTEITRSTPVPIREPSPESQPEKGYLSSSEWRRRYTGRQVECVVCLEEYVDGVSRVMSLPCGHEFHSECITPWLTTRRRTCPICKGDVVRTLASSTNNFAPFHDDPSNEDIQARAAETANNSPSAAIPIPRTLDEQDEESADLESGAGVSSPLLSPPARSDPQRRRGGFNAISLSSLRGISAAFGGGNAARRREREREERDR